MVVAKRTRSGAQWQRHFEQFTEDVKERGILQPIIAVGEGESARVVDGETRRQAALLAGLESIPILVYECELTESQLVIAQLTANAQRRDFTWDELAGIYAELMLLNGWSQAQLARNIHVSTAQVSKVLAISANLCEEVRALVAAGKVAPRAAYAMSRVEPQQQMELADKFVKGVLCVESVESRVAQILGKGEKKQKPMKVELGGVTIIVAATNVMDAMKSAATKLLEAIKRLEKDGLGAEFLPALLK